MEQKRGHYCTRIQNSVFVTCTWVMLEMFQQKSQRTEYFLDNNGMKNLKVTSTLNSNHAKGHLKLFTFNRYIYVELDSI